MLVGQQMYSIHMEHLLVMARNFWNLEEFEIKEKRYDNDNNKDQVSYSSKNYNEGKILTIK